MLVRIMTARCYRLLDLLRIGFRTQVFHQQFLRGCIPVRIPYTWRAFGGLLYPALAFIADAVDLDDFFCEERPVQLGVLGMGS